MRELGDELSPENRELYEHIVSEALLRRREREAAASNSSRGRLDVLAAEAARRQGDDEAALSREDQLDGERRSSDRGDACEAITADERRPADRYRF